ncbi:MAG: FKBP-type peptidyl-prolyl cis-trans isomerase SlyD [Archaeoglobi archaeon]|nr:FKBP-type peptidyl-prolyl cis-trans isomerase SlyD [Archaeoglobi archaeon]MDK2781051.1 FKBP-type peptidyl-prolyl cis-trans isomerase SlyD [Archaeoglobi archaeon]
MKVQKGHFVRMSYTGRTEDGVVFDTTDENIAKENEIFVENAKYGPVTVIAGAGYVIEGLDEEIIGKEVGYKGEVKIPPEKAFGEYDPSLVEIISITKFDQRPQPGMRVRVNGRIGTVETVIGRRVRVDFNHPLAGKNVIYEYEIHEIIEDLNEKIKAIMEHYLEKSDIDFAVREDELVINETYSMNFDQRWLLTKRRIVDDILKYTEIKKVIIQEVYEKEKREESSS